MTQKSSDQLLESLSALVDNEASELEVRRILKNVERNPEVRERWRSYNLIGSVLRKESNLNLGETVDIAERISAALASEQAFEQLTPGRQGAPERVDGKPPVSGSHKNGLINFVAKSAVAASFAGALVLGFNVFSPGQSGQFDQGSVQMADLSPRQQSQQTDLTLRAPLGFELPHLESRTVSSNSAGQLSSSRRTQMVSSSQLDDITDAKTQGLLNELLIHHASRASANGSLGIMPFARVSQMQQVEASD